MNTEGLNKIRDIVSDAWFFADEAEVAKRAQTAMPYHKDPLGYVYPANQAELKAILQVANQYQIPLWPVSKGKNWGYGAATAVREQNLIVVLERLNKIIEVNAKLAYAVIEPGVTYRQLHQYLQENQIPLAIDPIDGTADASVMGNALDRGHGGTNYGDHYSTLCGLEVMLPNGELLATGGGPANNKAWHTYKWGVGPSIEGLFSQGNFGIVVKAGIWLMPVHQHCVSISLEIDNDDQLIQAIEQIRQLQLENVIDSKLTIVNEYFILSIAIDYPQHLTVDGYLNDEAMASLRSQYNIPRWTVAAAIYGDSLTIFAKKRQIKKRLAQFGKLLFLGSKTAAFLGKVADTMKRDHSAFNLYALAGRLIEKITKRPHSLLETAAHAHSHHRGIPSDYFTEKSFFGSPVCFASFGNQTEINLAEHAKGKIWFAPVVPLEGEQALFLINGCKQIFHQHGFDFASGLLLFNPRTAIAICKITFAKDDPERREKAQVLFNTLHDWCIEHGYQVYRTNVAHMETVTACAPTYKQFLNTLKNSADPNNVIAPGKYGVG